MLTNDSTLCPGSILDSGNTRYRIVSVLGQGGFGITYLVMGELKVGNVTTEAKFAIKEHYPELYCSRKGDTVVPKADNLKEYARSKSDFMAEAKKLHSLGTQNENIVKVNEVFESNGTVYYVMQYINGRSLSSYVESKGSLEYGEAISLLSPIFDAVDFLHKSRINHLDIKPDNIMLHEGIDGVVPVLIDFGMSVHFRKNGEKTSPKGLQGVSEGYSPLEQYAGIKEFNPATDIYSLAATLLYTLTGEKPGSAAEIRLSDVRTALSGKAPASAVESICKALNKSYEDRTSSVALLKSDLDISRSDDDNRTKVINVGEEGKKRYTGYIFIGLAVILTVVAAFVFWPSGEKAVSENSAETEAMNDSIATIEEKNDIESPQSPSGKEEEAASVPLPEAKPEQNHSVAETSTPLPAKVNAGNNSYSSPDRTSSAQAPAKPAPTSGKLQLGYGTWTGGIRNGKPDGKGKLVFNSTHRVDRSTSQEANPGDYFIATYDNGDLISGKLYDSAGNLLKTIIP